MGEPGFTREVLLVEDHALTRTLLTETLEHAGFAVVAVADAHEALLAFSESDPDLLLTDIDLGSAPGGIELAAALKALAPHLAIVFLSNYASAAHATEGVRMPPGSAFVSKTELESTSVLLDAVEAVLRDRTPESGNPLLASGNPLAGLTRKQLRILRRLAEGWSNAEIAAQEEMTASALEKLMTRMFASLGLRHDSRVNSRVVATRMYIEAFGPPRSAISP
jgi:DNA-binding NarL/FixJ family response regulator